MYRIYIRMDIGLGFLNQYGNKTFKTEKSAWDEVKRLKKNGELLNFKLGSGRIKVLKD